MLKYRSRNLKMNKEQVNILLNFLRNGTKESSQRLIFVTGNFFAMTMGAITLFKYDWQASIAVTVGIAGVFGVNKAVQNFQENKDRKNELDKG